MQAALQEKDQGNSLLQKQGAQLQKLIGEKDTQINDVKAKSRDLQVRAQPPAARDENANAPALFWPAIAAFREHGCANGCRRT